MTYTRALFLFIVISANTYAQPHTIPVNGDNTIVINSKGGPDSLYTAVGRALVSSGFVIQTDNRDFLQISTKPKQLSEYDFSYDVSATINDNSITIIPTIHTTTVLGTYAWYHIKAKGTKNGVVLQDILKTFDGIGQITYEKRK